MIELPPGYRQGHDPVPSGDKWFWWVFADGDKFHRRSFCGWGDTRQDAIEETLRLAWEQHNFDTLPDDKKVFACIARATDAEKNLLQAVEIMANKVYGQCPK